MTHLLTPPSPTASAKRFAGRLWSDPDYRSVVVGIIAMVLVHSLLFVFAPYLLRSDAIHVKPKAMAAPPQFNIEIDPDVFSKPVPKPPPPNQFVEANPNANNKVPDKTNNFSFQNQTAAQEKPQEDQHNDKPKIDGKKDVNSNQIVSGSLSKPQETTPPIPDAAKAAKTQTAPRQEQDPLAGYDKMKAADDGFGSNLGKTQDNSKPAPEKVEGVKNAPLVEGAQSTTPAIDPKHPRARPVIQQMQVRPAIFKDNQFGTSNIGAVGYDAKWSSYGAYLHKMLEAIQVQWDRILIESATNPPPGSTVTVKFTLDSKGRVTEIIDVQNSSSEQGKASCLSAVTLTAPYGDWTDDMIAVLGNSQDITIQFYYQ